MITKIRPWREQDAGLIIQTWMSLLRMQGLPWYNEEKEGKRTLGWMPRQAFNALFRPYLKKVLQATGAVVACSTSDDDLIHGFRVGDADITHLVFVKSQYRRLGIAKMLCEGIKKPHQYTLVLRYEPNPNYTIQEYIADNPPPKGWHFREDKLWIYK
jgi:hypothetical protein